METSRKPHKNSAKTVPKQCQIGLTVQTVPNSAKQCQIQCVLYTLGSPTGPQKQLLPLARGRRRVLIPGAVRVGAREGYTGWVYQGGYQGGLYRVPSWLLEEGPRYSGAGPGRLLQGAWSGWYLGARANGRCAGPAPPLRGPVGPYGPSLGRTLRNAALGQ